MKSIAIAATPPFHSNSVEGALPFRAFSDLTLSIDGQAETDTQLLALAGYLVRQVLADLYPERVRRAQDVEPLLIGLKAHVRLDKGEMTAVASNPDSEAPPGQVVPGLVLGTFMLASNEPHCVGVSELHERLAPPGRLATLRETLADPRNAEVAEVISAMLPSMTVTLRPGAEAVRTLAYPGLLTRQPRRLVERVGSERYQVYLGVEQLHADQPLYRVAEELLERMLLALKAREQAAGRPGLLQRPQEWDGLRLVVGDQVGSEANYLFQPQSVLPAYGRELRCVCLAPLAYVLDPEYQLELGELLWEALADRRAREEWEQIQAEQGLAKASSLLTLKVRVRLDVLRQRGAGAAEVIASYTNSEVCAEASLPVPVAATVARLNASLIGALEQESETAQPGVMAPPQTQPARTDASPKARHGGFWAGAMLMGILLCFAAVAMDI
jgi:hypothetical protein